MTASFEALGFVPEKKKPDLNKFKDIGFRPIPKKRGPIAQTAREVGIGVKGTAAGVLGVLGDIQQLTNRLMGIESPIHLPTSPELKEHFKTVTAGKLEPETPREEFIEKATDLFGALAAPVGGGVKPLTSGLAALLGTGGEKLAKDIGAPEAVQKTLGIIGTLLPFLKRGRGLPPKTKAAQLAEKEAIKAPAAAVAPKLPRKRLRFAKETEKVRRRAAAFEKSVEKAKDRILESVTPVARTEKEAAKLSEAASDLFKSADAKAELIKGSVPTTNLVSAINRNVKRLLKSPALSTEEKGTLKFLNEIQEGLKLKDPEALRLVIGKNRLENLMAFNKSLNKEINFLKPTSGDRALLDVKEALMKDIQNVGKKHPDFYKDWKKANAAFSEFKRFGKIREALAPAFTEEGINFNKFEKLFSNVKKERQLTSLLGKEQFKRLKDISKLSKKSAEIFKALQKDSKLMSQIERFGNRGIMFSILFGRLKSLGIFAGEKVGIGLLRGYYGRLMTQPDFSKHYLNFLKALKLGGEKAIIVTGKKVNEDIEKTKKDMRD